MSKKALVTGCAGFIGSHLCQTLLSKGWKVIGIDCFTDYYDRNLKEKNLNDFINDEKFMFIEKDILKLSFEIYLKEVDYVFHQAGQPGVRGSWGKDFDIYIKNNILTTQYLLENVKDYPIKKFIYASSSSVYGNTEQLPMREDSLMNPYSPYGVTKLAGENLCRLYYENYGVPIMALRYFTVYGPRQRPEMAISKFIERILKNKEILMYGDGNQGRDFTYIDDIIQANIIAAQSHLKGEVFNVGSGYPVKLIEVVRLLEKIIGKKAKLYFLEKQRGDVKDTYADISKIQRILNFTPTTSIEKGLIKQVDDSVAHL